MRARGYAPELLAVEPGTFENPAELSIKLKAGHSIRGRVQDQAGQPIRGATLDASAGQFPWSFFRETMTATTDTEGLFTLRFASRRKPIPNRGERIYHTERCIIAA